MSTTDPWARWLTARRDAGSERQRERTESALAPVRDRILDAAEPLAGATVLDVGCGEGLVGLEALERVGEEGRVIFSDVSERLLELCRERVESSGLTVRAEFVADDATTLSGVEDGSVDVVTTRSVLLFVADKPRAFSSFHRVLRPGGRVSLFEPINRLTHPEPADRLWGYDVAAVADLAGRVKAAYAALEDPAAASMGDFDDRDLVRLAEHAGFGQIRLDCRHTVTPGQSLTNAIDLDVLLDSAPNPLAPTLRECLERALDPGERRRLVEHLGHAHEAGAVLRRSVVAYLVAVKPA